MEFNGSNGRESASLCRNVTTALVDVHSQGFIVNSLLFSLCFVPYSSS